MAYWGNEPAQTAVKVGDNTILSSSITDGSIVNADINSSAAIATSKISGALTSVNSHGLATSATTDTTNASNIASGTLNKARLPADSDTITSVGTLTGLTITGESTFTRTSGSYTSANLSEIPGANFIQFKPDSTVDEFLYINSVSGGSVSLSVANAAGDASNDLILQPFGSNVGIGISNPTDYNTSADDLVIGGTSGAHGMTIVTSTSHTGYLFFADGTSGDSEYEGGFQYDHGTDALGLYSAGSVRLTINSSGSVGIGTSSPDATNNQLHVKAVTSGHDAGITLDRGGSKTHIMMNNGTSEGFTVANKLLNAPIRFRVNYANSEVNALVLSGSDKSGTFGGWVYVDNRVMSASGDIRVGSNDGNEMLHLLADGTAKIDTAGTSALTIDSSQNTTMTGNLHIDKPSGNSTCTLTFDAYNDGGNVEMYYNHNNGTERLFLDLFDGGVQSWKLYDADGLLWTIGQNATSITWASDSRLKKEVKTIPNALATINSLRGVNFKWNAVSKKKDTSTLRYGFIAQEVKEVDQNLVETFTDDVELPNLGDIYGVNRENIIPILVEAIKSLSAKVTVLENA